MFRGTDKAGINLLSSLLKFSFFRYFNMIGDTMAESQAPMDKLVDNMKKRKIADYFQDCLCTENNHRLCDLIMSKFYRLSGFTKSVWKSERLETLNRIDLDNFAVNTLLRVAFVHNYFFIGLHSADI